MPRNILPPVRSPSASNQAIAPPERAHLKRSSRADYHPAPCDAKKTHSRIPAPQIERIRQRHIVGQSQREIARAEGRSRPTIARIVKSEEMQAYVQGMRERFYALAPDALSTIEYAMQVQRDARIAYDVLRDIGIVPRKNEPVQLPDTTPMDGYTRQAIMVANVLVENEKYFGKMPANMVEAIKKIESH